MNLLIDWNNNLHSQYHFYKDYFQKMLKYTECVLCYRNEARSKTLKKTIDKYSVFYAKHGKDVPKR